MGRCAARDDEEGGLNFMKSEAKELGGSDPPICEPIATRWTSRRAANYRSHSGPATPIWRVGLNQRAGA